jgi:hypothetical protein
LLDLRKDRRCVEYLQHVPSLEELLFDKHLAGLLLDLHIERRIQRCQLRIIIRNLRRVGARRKESERALVSIQRRKQQLIKSTYGFRI